MRKYPNISSTVAAAIAAEFRAWLSVHPGKPRSIQVKVFDKIADRHLDRIERMTKLAA